MAYILRVLIIDGGDRTIKVAHEFYGLTEQEAETYYREHLGSCDYFRSAQQEGRTLEEIEEVEDDELPTPEEFEEFEEEDLTG